MTLVELSTSGRHTNNSISVVASNFKHLTSRTFGDFSPTDTARLVRPAACAFLVLATAWLTQGEHFHILRVVLRILSW